MKPWQTIARKTLCQPNQFLTVELHEVELPDGRRINDWPWVITPDYANVLAQTEAGRFLCFRQVKYAVAGVSLAPVGGYLEPGEDPLVGAQRELLEETGYTATAWHALGGFPVDANRGAGHAYFFLALNARRTAIPQVTDLEEQELLLLTRRELADALERGEFKTLPWVTAVALALHHLETTNPKDQP